MNSPFKHLMQGPAEPVTVLDGKQYLYFAGVGYYNLHNNREVKQAAINAIIAYGINSATSRMMTGTTPAIKHLEEKIADFFGKQDAAYLPSGYLSNIAGISALINAEKADAIFIDEGSHYCNLEGAFASGVNVFKFRHKDPNNLEELINLNLKPGQKPLIATDGMFPLFGDLAPVEDYLIIAEKYDGVVWIDDAHPVGVLGQNGRGTYEHFNLNSDRLFFGATLSKAFGAYGGFIAGDEDFIYAVKTSNVMKGSSSPVSAAVGAGIKGIEILKNKPEMRQKLWNNATYLKTKMSSIGINAEINHIPIFAFTTGNAEQMKKIQKKLMDRGIFIQYSKYVGAGDDGVLRMVVFSNHTLEQIDNLVDNLKALL